jgi:hypothetical protein
MCCKEAQLRNTPTRQYPAMRFAAIIERNPTKSSRFTLWVDLDPSQRVGARPQFRAFAFGGKFLRDLGTKL